MTDRAARALGATDRERRDVTDDDAERRRVRVMDDQPSFRDGPRQPTARPARRDHVREYRLGDELLLYVPQGETAHALNASAASIWELCDGIRTVDDISRELGQFLGCPGEALLANVSLAVAQLAELGLVDAR